MGLDITEEQLKVAKTKSLLIELFKQALAQKGLPKAANAPAANAVPANAAPKPTNAPAANAAPKPANAAPANAAPKANANSAEGNVFNPETADAGGFTRELYRLANRDAKKGREIARCKSGAGKVDCLKKIYYNWAAQEAKAEHQGDPEDEAKKEKAIEAAAKIGMSEDEAEEWLQNPVDGGKRKTRKNPRRRSKMTRRR